MSNASSTTSAPLFNFELCPVDHLMPWGKDRNVHWYALTQGSFWITVGDEELFRYREEQLEQWRSQGFAAGGYYDEYFVMGLWDDFRVIYPFAIEKVPEDIIASRSFIEDVRQRFIAPQARNVPSEIVLRLAEPDDSSASLFSRLCFDATGWWRDRRLPVMHLRYNPDIYFWRDREMLNIEWSSTHCRCDGKPVWEAEQGVHSLPFSTFNNECADFQRRFREAMRSRVDEFLALQDKGDITCDEALLERTQCDFERGGDKILTSPAITDWDHVWTAINRLKKLI